MDSNEKSVLDALRSKNTSSVTKGHDIMRSQERGEMKIEKTLQFPRGICYSINRIVAKYKLSKQGESETSSRLVLF